MIDLTSKVFDLSKKVEPARRQTSILTLALLVSAVVFAYLAVTGPLFAQTGSQLLVSVTTPQPLDSNKGPSEFNHHIAGWALVGVGLLALASLVSSKLRAHQCLWPVLFVLAGVYLALWSDGEIWPRGNLSWAWLLQHDAEARQHKIYSVLLIGIGILEYVRIRGSLRGFWKTWAFPVLAAIGACMLMIHDHTSGSGAHSHEAQAYLVNPALDIDGGPRKSSSFLASAASANDQHNMCHSSGGAMDAFPADSASIPMDHSHTSMDASPFSGVLAPHQHFMTASMLRVEREHMSFMIVGLAIGLFKFIADGKFFRNRIVPYVWPSCMLMLGVLLVFYRE